MKIATWNVNSIRARLARLTAWLDRHRPDVLCLQETKVIDDDFPADAIEAAGYRCAFYGQKSYNGVAILARDSPGDPRPGLLNTGGDEEARLIAATVSNVRIISAYTPNGREVGTDHYERKLAWLDQLRVYCDTHLHSDQDVVLCGDFNVAPDGRDVYDPDRLKGAILCSEPERKALRSVVDWGFVDAFRQHHEESGLFSWWDYRRLGFPKNRGLRIDHIYLSKSLAARCRDAFIDRNERKGKQPSDHAPVVAEIAE